MRIAFARLTQAILLFTTLSASAQGTINLNNRVTVGALGTVNSPIFGPDLSDPTFQKRGGTPTGNPAGNQTYGGPRLAGTSFTAELWYAPGTNAPEFQLRPAVGTTVFRTGAGAGYVVATVATLPGVTAGRVTLQLRVWDNQGGTLTTWEQARGVAAQGTSSLFSPPFNVGDDFNPPPALQGLESFEIGGLPNIPSNIRLSSGALSGNHFQFVVSGWGTVEIDSSVLDGNWSAVGSVQVNGSATFVHTNAAQQRAARLYRARLGDRFSTNVIGFVRLPLPNGFSLIGNQLHAASSRIEDLIPNAPFGTTIYKYSNQTGYSIYTYDDLDNAWIPPGGTLETGEGAFVFNPASPFSVVFVGELPQYTCGPTITPGFSLLTGVLTAAGSAFLPGYSFSGGEAFYPYRPGEGYNIAVFDDIDLMWVPTIPRLNAGEGFFLYTPHPLNCTFSSP